MKLLLCTMMMMMMIAASRAGRIIRSIDDHTLQENNFPNLHTVNHGHGATSYQNVNIENQHKPHTATQHIHEFQYQVSPTKPAPFVIVDGTNDLLFASDNDPYTSNNIEHVEINSIAEPFAYYDHYDFDYDYGLH
ncbi:uncharacterized protein LOC124295190 [Neodiprion lecontei]|uniref:Uncharacterized protein LOC124295190 n=1 Tax=Neodiprion lecontei TaxID=441921 RepID=A0ABM3GIQ4_NEOLC|nr:uncharacterized protein LOC124295190 [Neodiprion lecontei]